MAARSKTKPPKSQPPPRITRADLKRFLATESDFAFEMKVRQRLRELGFETEHGGAYTDPVTDKVRQFDIRAWRHEDPYTLALAVECKNFHQSNALLVSTVPRTESEAFHSVVQRHDAGYAYSSVHRTDRSSIYLPGHPVAKSTDQVRRDTSGKFVSSDQETFERLNQAINSCKDLCERFTRRTQKPLYRVVVPVLVVPARRLWQVDYNEAGLRIGEPRTTKGVPFYLSHAWTYPGPHGPSEHTYTISHVEILTADNLQALTERLLAKVLLGRTS